MSIEIIEAAANAKASPFTIDKSKGEIVTKDGGLIQPTDTDVTADGDNTKAGADQPIDPYTDEGAPTDDSESSTDAEDQSQYDDDDDYDDGEGSGVPKAAYYVGAGIVGLGLIWWLRRRSKKNQQSGTGSVRGWKPPKLRY